MAFVVWFSLFTGLSVLLGFILRPWRHEVLFKFLFFPGVLVSGLSRYLVCLLTGTEVKKTNFFWAKGPHIEHEEPKPALLGPTLLAFVPFILCVVLLFCADWMLEHPIPFNHPLPNGSETLVDASVDTLIGSVKALPNAPWGLVRTWLFLYLFLSFLVGAAPVTTEILYLCGGVGLLVLFFWQVSYWEVSAGTFAYGWWSIWNPAAEAWTRFSLMFGLTILAIILLSITVGTMTLIDKAAEKKDPKHAK